MDNTKFVLQYCMDNARRGEREISVFDLMYEGIEYPKLKPVLATLAERGEIEIIDIKTFRFIGETRELENPLKGRTNERSIFDIGINSEYIRALEYVIKDNTASASYIQRKLGTSYLEACKIIDWMESKGFITPPNGPYARKVLITQAEFDARFNNPPPEDDLFVVDDDDDDDEYDEDPFEALERYQEERLRILREHEEELKEEGPPAHPSWTDEFEFMRRVRQEKEQIIKSDKDMGVKGAIKKVESLLAAARRIGNEPLAEVFERVIFELDHMTPYEYTKLKKKYFG